MTNIEKLNGMFVKDCQLRIMHEGRNKNNEKYSILIERNGSCEKIGECSEDTQSGDSDMKFESYAVLNGQFINVHDSGISRKLLLLLSNTIPAGHSVTLRYDGDDEYCKKTGQELSINVPPSCTPLGFVLISSSPSFTTPKDIQEGERMVVTKANNLEEVFSSLLSESSSILEFLKKKCSIGDIEVDARGRARDVLLVIQNRIKDFKKALS